MESINGRHAWVVTLLFVVLALSSIAMSQGSGQILGTVHDSTGAVVPGATVTIRNIQTGLARTVQTAVNGDYSAPMLPVGEYEITVAAQGFATVVRSGVNLAIAQQARLDFELKVSSVDQKLTIEGDTPLVDTQSAALGNVEVGQRVEELPLNKRDFYQLSVLQPGVLPPYSARGSIGTAQVAGGMESQPQVNGLRESNNYAVLDGGFITDPYYNTATAVPNPDAISEFKLQTNMTSVRYGRGAGAVINVATKSGGNAIHGGAYEFVRNNAFDARNYFVDEVPELKRHQFGANIGGPIISGKSFFFVSYEGLRQRRGEAVSATVPSLAARQGDFSDQPAGSILDPNTGEPFTTPSNFNPALINPMAQRVINLYPAPNKDSNGNGVVDAYDTLWSGAPIGRARSDQAIGRWDHVLTSSQNIGARYVYQQQTALKNFARFAFSGPVNVPGFPTEDLSRTNNFVVWHTMATKRLVNDARFAFQRNWVVFSKPISGIDHTSFGFNFPQPNTAKLGDIFPQFGIGGYSSIGNADGDLRRNYSVYQWQDTVTLTKGKHNLALGAEANRYVLDSQGYFVRMGVYYFLGFFSTNPVADMLMGTPSFFAITEGDPTRNYRSTGFNWFVEDTYKVTPRLVLTLGLRYELQTAPIETHNRLAIFSPENAAAGVVSKIHPDAPAGAVYSGDPGFPRSLVRTDKNNFAPRVAFAWDPTGTGKTSIRAGFGIFYDQAPIMPYVDSSLNPPYSPLYFFTPDPTSPFAFSNPVATDPTIPQTSQEGTVVGTRVPEFAQYFGPGENNRSPYVKQWNLSVQREITPDLGVSVAYVGNSATKLLGSVDINQPRYVPGDTTVENAQDRRPYPNMGLIFEHGTRFSSNYNGLQVSANKRMKHGVSFVAAYTWSRTIDYNSQSVTYYHILGHPVLPQNSYDLRAERGLSSFDVPHRFVLSGTWELPGANKHNGIWRLAGGWQFNGIFSANSGYPITIVDSLNPSQTQEYGPTDRPNLVGDPNAGPHRVDEWFNVKAFQPLDIGQGFGNAGRNIVRGPGLQNIDLSIFKNIPLTERYKLQFRAEFFNLFNHANFLPPINDIRSPDFGRITETATDAREMQFALKLSF